MRKLLSHSLVALLFLALGFALTASFDFDREAAAQNKLWFEKQTNPAGLSDDQLIDLGAFKRLAKTMSPAVVNINTVRARGGKKATEYLKRQFNGRIPPEYMNRGMGSGFIIHPNGWVLSNNHVVEDATQIQVQMHDGTVYEARVVGADPRTDVALLKIEPKEELAYAPLGNSTRLEIGEWVLAIGNPFGLNHTVTAGIVSAKGRSNVNPDGRQAYANFIQTDASINPGNSGGPLINMRGEVIGINTAINSAGQGIGFAIPIDMVKTLVPQLKRGQVRRSWLGVQIQPVSAALAQAQGLRRPRGALVVEVVDSGPAGQAGVQPGDIITKFNGRPVKKMKDLPWLASTAGIGKTVQVTVLRGGKERAVRVTMGVLPGQKGVTAQPATTPEPVAPKIESLAPAGFGMTVEPLTSRIASRFKVAADTGAVIVTSVQEGGPAAEAGVETGDVILKVSNANVTSAEEFAKLAADVETGRVAMMLISRDGRKLFRAFTRR